MDDTIERNIVPTSGKKELAKSPLVLINQAKELLKQDSKVAVVPAHPSRQGVRILVHPGYFSAYHGIKLMSFNENGATKLDKTKPSLYAAYLFNIDGADEMRFVTMPVALFPNREAYNDRLLQEMEEQDFPSDMVRANCDLAEVQKLYGPWDTRDLPGFRFLVQGKKFLVEGPHPDDRSWILTSGWNPRDFERSPGGELTIIGDDSNYSNPQCFYEKGIYNVFDQSTLKSYLGGNGVNIISAPLTSASLGESEVGVLQKVVAANK